MLLQLAMNGSRKPAEVPQLPVTPAQMAASAIGAVRAGVQAIHIHARNAAAQESVHADDVAADVAAIRAAVPETSVGVSTGAWIIADPAERLKLIAAWKLLPDYASVNFHEAGARELAGHLLSRGMDVEAGLITAAAAENLARSGLAHRCFRMLIEPQQQELREALQNGAQIIAALDAVGYTGSRLYHGFDATAWTLLDDAIARGYDTRIGMEDAVTLPDGSPAAGNAALVTAAVQRIAVAQKSGAAR